MITVLEVKRVANNKELVEVACSSNDTKPTNVMNGSMCIEVDTGSIYVFDEANESWTAIG